jgi:putative ABC transport system substrate-binding protein
MKVTRAALTVVLALGILAAPFAAEAQTGKVYRVGVLWFPGFPVPLDAFREGLRDLGYVDGKNAAVELRIVDPLGRELEMATELVRLKVEVLVALGTRATRAAREATNTIPIVMVGAADPVGDGLVSSLARPGGNITGSTHMGSELSAKRLQLLKEIVPAARRVAVLFNPTDAGTALDWKETEAAAAMMGLTLLRVEVRAAEQFEAAFARMKTERAAALVVFSHTFTFTHRERIVELAARHRLPAMYGFASFPRVGGLVAYEINWADLGRSAAVLVDKIFKGAKPADLPVEQPTRFELVVNVKTAKALGLTIPPALLMRADQTIE